MIRRWTRKFSLLTASLVLSACGSSSLNTDWKNTTSYHSNEDYINSIISNDDASISVVRFKDRIAWIDDKGTTLANKELNFDPDLVGNEPITKILRRSFIKRKNQWTLQSRVELEDGTQKLILMPVDFSNGYLPDASGFLPGNSITLEQAIPALSYTNELSTGDWLFVTPELGGPAVDIVKFSPEGVLLSHIAINDPDRPLGNKYKYWVTDTDSLMTGNENSVFEIKNGQVNLIWSAKTDCGVENSRFDVRSQTPVINEIGEAIVGCGDDQLVRIQTDGTILHYFVEFPSNSKTLMEVNFMAKPNGHLWFAAMHSSTACNPDGSCTGAFLNQQGVIKRFSLDGSLEVDNRKLVKGLGYIGTMPPNYLLNDGSALFLSYQGDGGYTLVDNAGTPKWSAYVPGLPIAGEQAGPSFLSPSGHLFLVSDSKRTIYRFDTSKR